MRALESAACAHINLALVELDTEVTQELAVCPFCGRLGLPRGCENTTAESSPRGLSVYRSPSSLLLEVVLVYIDFQIMLLNTGNRSRMELPSDHGWLDRSVQVVDLTLGMEDARFG